MKDNDSKKVKTIWELLQIAPVGDAPLSEAGAADEQGPEEDLPVQFPAAEQAEADESGPKEEFQPLPAADDTEEVDLSELKTPAQSLMSRNYVRYPVIFVSALIFFYVILNFQAVGQQLLGVFSPPKDNQNAVLAEGLEDYNRWIEKYYFYTSDLEVLAANHDADGDGLTNLEEFYMNTNPFLRDTDSDGFDDGQELINGFNPLYIGHLTAGQSQLIAGNTIDLAKVQSRKEFRAASSVAGQSVLFDDFTADTAREGRVTIAKLGVDVPLVWNKNFEWIQDDLKHGVVHHPDTVVPGERGLSSIHGHSSGYVWDGDYKNAFTKINLLEPGDEVFVTVFGLNGESRSYRYVVRGKQVFEAEDPAQFADQGGYYLNLSTSWPIGTARQRYVVTTELAGL